MDHVRGSSLVWPATLETLRPFVLTWWSGRTVDDMPKDVRAVFDAANFRQPHINLALVVLDEKGQYLRSSVPNVRPPSFRFDPEAQGRDFKDQLDELLVGLTLPKVERPAKPKLTLPEICDDGQPSGVRIYLTAEANRLKRETLTPLLVQQNAIDKLNPNVQVILLPSNSNFLLPSNLFGKSTTP